MHYNKKTTTEDLIKVLQYFETFSDIKKSKYNFNKLINLCPFLEESSILKEKHGKTFTMTISFKIR